MRPCCADLPQQTLEIFVEEGAILELEKTAPSIHVAVTCEDEEELDLVTGCLGTASLRGQPRRCNGCTGKRLSLEKAATIALACCQRDRSAHQKRAVMLRK